MGLLAVAVLLAGDVSRPAGAATSPPLRTRSGAVAADHGLASRAGAGAIARGGNAVDAAAATALALGVVNPASSGIGGGGFALVYLAAEDKVYAFDFREVAPAALGPDDFVRNGAVDPLLARRGGLAVGVPGEIAGLELLVRRFGRLSFRRAVAPAIALAVAGWPASWFLGDHVTPSVVEVADPAGELHAWLHQGRGGPIAAGRPLRHPALARTLSVIAREGSAGFYRGPVAADLVATVRAAGGVMTAEDLAGYRVVEREPLWGRFRDLRIATMPLPSSGGIALLEALGIIEAHGADLAALGPGSSAMLHLVAEVGKHVFADRSRFLGDAEPARLIGGELLRPERLAALAARIAPDKVAPHDRYGDAALGNRSAKPARGGGTSHLCVVDRDGNAVALTTTVNGYFGSKLMTRGGITLNNEIDDFTIAPGVPNMFGLVQSEHNVVGPGKRPLSSMTPVLVFRGRAVVGCLGGSGGPRIISNVMQVFLDLFVLGMDARQAVSAPRVHHQWLPDELVVDADIPADVVDALIRRGHAVRRQDWRDEPASVQAIRVLDGGVIEAASDPRKGGEPAGP